MSFYEWRPYVPVAARRLTGDLQACYERWLGAAEDQL